MSRRKKQVVIGIHEVRDANGALLGLQIFEPHERKPMYQVCPLDENIGWGVALIAHEDPFEMVDLGVHPSIAEALQVVERDIIKQHKDKEKNK